MIDERNNIKICQSTLGRGGSYGLIFIWVLLSNNDVLVGHLVYNEDEYKAHWVFFMKCKVVVVFCKSIEYNKKVVEKKRVVSSSLRLGQYPQGAATLLQESKKVIIQLT